MRPRRVLAAAAFVLAVAMPARAADPPQALELEVGSGRLTTLSGAAANVFVADPKVAEVHPAAADKLFIFGVGPGRTSVAALDADGHTLADFRVVVRASSFAATQAEAAVQAAMPGAKISIQPEPKGLLVSGTTATPEEAARVLAIANAFLGPGQSIEDQIGVQSTVQVSLQVRIAEMSRSVTNNLGVNWEALGTIGSIGALPALTLAANSPSGVVCAAGTLFGTGCKGGNFNGVIQALVQDNLARVLAEPNLTAMSGQPASFLAGGEYPIPVSQGNGNVAIQYKDYGVRLTFVPTVLTSGRISLHVAPEVSQLTTAGAVTLSAGNSTIQVPALTVRRAETTIEVGSGESFAIAGLLQDVVNDEPSGLPFLSNIPILGALFRSDSFTREETELVVLVTPYVVRPVSDPTALHYPGEGYRAPSDLERILLLRQAAGQPVPKVEIPGEAGFIVQ